MRARLHHPWRLAGVRRPLAPHPISLVAGVEESEVVVTVMVAARGRQHRTPCLVRAPAAHL